MSRNISLPRQILNAMLRPFGWCVGRVISAQKNEGGSLVDYPLPTGWRAYRLLRLRREGFGGGIGQDIGG